MTADAAPNAKRRKTRIPMSGAAITPAAATLAQANIIATSPLEAVPSPNGDAIRPTRVCGANRFVIIIPTEVAKSATGTGDCLVVSWSVLRIRHAISDRSETEQVGSGMVLAVVDKDEQFVG